MALSAALAWQAQGQDIRPAPTITASRDAQTSTQNLNTSAGSQNQPSPFLTIPLPLFVSVETIQSQLQEQLFTDKGRFFPCPMQAECFKKAGQLYLEEPHISVEGARLKFQAHLGGRVSGPIFTHPSVSSDITAYGIPVVEGNVLRFEQVQMESTSSNLLFRFGAGSFKERTVSQIEQKARYDLTSALTAAKVKINSGLPFQWGKKCLGVQLADLSVASVTPVSSPDGVQTVFNAAIGLAPGDTCH